MLNISKKRNHGLVISIIFLLSFGYNNICASGEVKYVNNGVLTINSEKIVYKYNGIESGEKEIKGWKEETKTMDKSIQLSQEILQALFGDSKNGNLDFNYLINSEVITVLGRGINNLIGKNILFTGTNTRINISNTELNLGSVTQGSNSVFAMMGINLTNYDTLFKNSGITTINTDYILFTGNRIYNKNNVLLFYNHDNSTLNLNGKNIAIESNDITSSKGIFLVGNSGTMTFGSESTEVLIFNNKVGGGDSTYLFYNHNNSELNLNGKYIIIKSNDITSSSKEAYLFYNSGAITFGSESTETLTFSENKVKGENNNAFLFYNHNNSELNLNGKKISLESNTITSLLGVTHLFGNSGTITFGSESTETLIFNNKVSGKGIVSLFFNNGLTLNLNGKKISLESNTITSLGKRAHLFGNFGTTTLGSESTEALVFNNNVVNGENHIYLFYNESTLNLNGKNISITNNTISPAFKFDDNEGHKYSVIFENKKTLNIGLYGDNPSFTLANNGMTENSNDKRVIGIAMITSDRNGPQLNFKNNSNTEAKITLEHDIRSFYFDNSDKKFKTNNDNINSTITFKNSEGNNNGSFSINLGTNLIEANTINIEANTTLLLTINGSELIGSLKGVGNSPKLNIVKIRY